MSAHINRNSNVQVLTQIQEATQWLLRQSDHAPKVAVVLGSGLGELADGLDVRSEFSYAQIPHFPVSTVHGHAGKLIFGHWQGKSVVVMSGRFHYYEGYTMQEVVFPVRVMKSLGAQTIFITNASGGLHPDMRVGDLMIVTDHINTVSENPLRGPNLDDLGPRFVDQHAVYDRALIQKALELAAQWQIRLYQGVYVAVAGPTFETPAEYRYYRIIGGDAVGMSTVPEVIAAHHMGMRICCLSVITDLGTEPVPVSHEQVVLAARTAAPRMMQLLGGLISYG